MFNKLQFQISIPILILSLVMTAVIMILFKFLPPKLPLFYSIAWGNGQLATQKQFLIIPASISLITILNLVISRQLHPSQSFFKKVLLISSIVASVILITTFIKIILMFV